METTAMKSYPRLARLQDALARSVDNNIGFYLIGLLWVYLVVMGFRALGALMWYDELITWHLCRLPSMAATWSAIKAGADLNPPLHYAVVRAFQAFLGQNQLAARLPSIVAFAVACACVFLFVRRHLATPLALAAMLFPLLTNAAGWAYEARPHALVLAGAGLALVSWQAATMGSRRRLPALAGIAIGLAVALLSHCLAVLLAVPFVIGEVARSLRQKRIDWPVWLAFAAATPALLFYPSLLFRSHGSAAVAIPAFQVTLGSFANFYEVLLAPAIWPLAAALVLALLLPQGDCHEASTRPAMPAHEIAALLGFAALPVFAILLAKFLGGVFYFRYGLAAVIGFSALLPWLLRRDPVSDRRLGAVLALLFAAVFAGSFLLELLPGLSRVRQESAAAAGGPSIPGHPLLTRAFETGLPLVIGDAKLVITIDHYGTPELVSRTYYLTDSHAAIRYTGSDVFEHLNVLRTWFQIRPHIEDYASFVAAHRSFLLYCDPKDELQWILPKLTGDGAQLNLKGITETALLLEVTPSYRHD